MQEKTISFSKANLFSFLFLAALIPIVIYPYHLVHRIDLETLFSRDIHIVYFVSAFFLSIVVHELLHAVVFAYYAKRGWKSVKIGVLWKYMTPYAHCSEPLTKKQYELGVISPGVVLGFLPIIYAFIVGNLLLLFYGITMLIAAGGDLIIFLMLQSIPKSKKILDHDNKCGFWIVSES